MCTKTCVCFVLILYAIWCASTFAERLHNELVSINDCAIAKKDYEPNPIEHCLKIVTVKKKKYIQQNYTVEQKTLPVYTTITGYSIKKTIKMEYEVANLTCANRVVSLVWKRMGLKYDKNCCLLKGVRSIGTSTNLDEFHMKIRPISLLQVGHRQYDVKLHTKRGVLMCLSVTLNVTKY